MIDTMRDRSGFGVFVADSRSTWKWTQEGGIYVGKQLTSWEVQKNWYPGKLFVSLGRELCYF